MREREKKRESLCASERKRETQMHCVFSTPFRDQRLAYPWDPGVVLGEGGGLEFENIEDGGIAAVAWQMGTYNGSGGLYLLHISCRRVCEHACVFLFAPFYIPTEVDISNKSNEEITSTHTCTSDISMRAIASS